MNLEQLYQLGVSKNLGLASPKDYEKFKQDPRLEMRIYKTILSSDQLAFVIYDKQIRLVELHRLGDVKEWLFDKNIPIDELGIKCDILSKYIKAVTCKQR